MLVNNQNVISENAHLQFILEAAGIGIWDLDLVSGQVIWDERCRQLFGFAKGEVVSYNQIFKYIHPEDAEIVDEAVRKALDPVIQSAYEVRYRTIGEEGEVCWILSKGKAYFNDEGIAIRFAGTAQDTTAEVLARKNLEEIEASLEQEVQLRTEELLALNEELSVTNEELNEANKQLSHSNEELAQYAYVASHDLQEPLRKIRLFSGMLESQESLPVENKRLINKIAQSAGRMSMLIRDLLDFSRLLKKEMPVQKVDLSKALAEVISDFELTIEEKQATVRVGCLPVIEAVALQMNQLFYNLLSNALKFISQGITPEIVVDAQIMTHEEVAKYISNPLSSSHYYHLTFSDNGIGFETKYADQIFEVFKRLHGRTAYPGSGIGLALCKRIVGNHNGHIYVVSEVGFGTTFHLILPDKSL